MFDSTRMNASLAIQLGKFAAVPEPGADRYQAANLEFLIAVGPLDADAVLVGGGLSGDGTWSPFDPVDLPSGDINEFVLSSCCTDVYFAVESGEGAPSKVPFTVVARRRP